MNLARVMRLARRAAPLTPENYPKRAGLEGEDALAFDLTHSIRHLDKNIGVLQAMLEQHDHGEKGALGKLELRRAAVKLLGGAAGICSLLDLSGEDAELMLKLEFTPR